MPRKAHPFADEAELCAAFIGRANEQGWSCYPETKSYDLVLCRGGIQIGVQAKLRFNATLLRQILPSRYIRGAANEHPHHLAILLPCYDEDVSVICDALGIAFFYYSPADSTEQIRFRPDCIAGIRWDHCGHLPLELPDYRSDARAGTPSPLILSEWKIRALKLCALLELQGFLTAEDFLRLGMDHRRWTYPYNEWLVIRDGQFVAGEGLRFAEQHPDVYATILQEMRNSSLADSALV